MSVAFQLRAEFRDTFAGAHVNAGPNGEALDTAEALKEGDGTIVLADEQAHAIQSLDEHPQFKRVSVPQDAEPVAVADGYEELNVDGPDGLKALLRQRDLPTTGTKDELIERLRAHDREA